MIEGKRIFITGSAGSVGSELYAQLATKNTVLGLDINETGLFDLHEEYRLKGFDVHYRLGDVRNRETVRDAVSGFHPDIIFHAAALKHVTPNEVFPEEAVETNVKGTLNVVDAARRNGVPRLVYISTDKAINSWSVMGVTKKLGELITKNAGYTAVRFGNVLGSRGSVVPIWQRQLSTGEPLTVTDERMERYFMSIEEACELLIKAAEIGEGGEVMIMEMGALTNVLQMAKDILGKAGKSPDQIKMIGVRPGETLKEELMTPEELARATKIDGFWVIKEQI
jgi:FlaA1/EpsC-like NDP-sugar epimerase